MPASKSTTNTNMPAKKSNTTTATTPVASTEVAAPKVARKSAAKAEVTVPTTTTAAPAVATETRSADAILTSIQESLRALNTEFTARVRAAVHDAQEAAKALKREQRNSKRKHKKNPDDMTPEERKVWEARRANNAFLKLRPISDELSTFMGLPPKSQRSQTDVTKFISNYVKVHNCFDPNFKRRIIPDAKLGKILRVKDGQDVTYLNLQSFLKVHFIKTV